MKIYIASSKKNIVEEKVLITSLIESSNLKEDINILAADENRVYNFDRTKIFRKIFDTDIEFKQSTLFSTARFFVPMLSSNEDTVIIDPDTLVFANLKSFFKKLKTGIYMRKAYGLNLYASSVILYTKDFFDNEKIQNYKKAVLNKNITWMDKLYFNGNFCRKSNLKITKLSKSWNQFDFYFPSTKIIHYTNLYNQPWVFDGHPFEDLWINFFRMSINRNILKMEDIYNQQKESTTFDNKIKACKKDLHLLVNDKYKKKKQNLYKFFRNEIRFHSMKKYFYNIIL